MNRLWLYPIFLILIFCDINAQDGIISYYPFEGNANDVTGNGNDGIIHGAILVADKFGNPNAAIHLDGIDDYIEIPNESNFDLTEFTIISTIKVQDNETNNTIISKGLNLGNFTLRILDDQGSWPGYVSYAHQTINGNWASIASNNSIAIDEFLQIAVTVTSTEFRSYINGELERENNAVSPPVHNDEPVIIGASEWNHFSGVIDDIRIYNRALSGVEIRTIFQVGGWPDSQIEILTTSDCVVSSSQPETNLNGNALTVLYNEAEEQYNASLVYFDISSIPSNAEINSAHLSLYNIAESGDVSIRIGRLSSTPIWLEDELTWNNMPYSETPPSICYYNVVANTWNHYGVTGFLRGWHYGTYTNNGFQIFTESNNTLAMFYPRESGTEFTPRLNINYSIYPAPIAYATPGSNMGEIDLIWTRPSGDVTGFKIVYDEDSDNPPWNPDQNGTPESGADVGDITSITIGSLMPGQEYHLAVAAYNSNVISDFSDVATSIAAPGPGIEIEPTSLTFQIPSEDEDIQISQFADNKVIIISSSSNNDTLDNIVKLVTQNSGKILLRLPPRTLIGYLPRELASRFLEIDYIDTLSYSVINADYDYPFTSDAVKVWNRIAEKDFSLISDTRSNIESFRDVVPPIDKSTLRQSREFVFPEGESETSLYFIGNTTIKIILPESTGAINTENWSETQIGEIYNEICGGLLWWAMKQWNPVNFTVPYPEVCNSSFEPITMMGTDWPVWAGEILNEKDYIDDYFWQNMYDYTNDLRGNVHDWAVAIFIANSENDADGRFEMETDTTRKFAFAYLNGPSIIMTSDNNGYGLENMDAVLAHEIGHSFGALDEYFDAQHSCYEEGGFLQVENQNSEYGSCLFDVSCIMRGQVSPFALNSLCIFSEGQVGWRDQDFDGVTDCIDTDFNGNSDLNGNGIVDYWDYLVSKVVTVHNTGTGPLIVANIIPSEDWIWAYPDTLSVLPGQYKDVFVSVSAPQLPYAVYSEDIQFYSNDPNPENNPLGVSILVNIDPITVSTQEKSYRSTNYSFGLENNFPNPFNPSTNIRYELIESSMVDLTIYNIIGQRVKTLISHFQEPDYHEISWNGTNYHGENVEAGLYLAKLKAGQNSMVIKMVYLH